VGTAPGGSVLSAVINEWSVIQRVNAQDMLNQLIDLLSETDEGIVYRVQTDERVARILAEAASAAATADMKAKIRALSVVASRALADDAAFDEAGYVIGVLRELHVIDVELLVALEAAHLPDETGLDTSDALRVTAGVAKSLNAKLLRLGLIETPGLAFTGQHLSVRLGEFGAQILALLRESSDGQLVRPPGEVH
jgi:hypothetical protein